MARGWYWVSKHASPDYFHIAGLGKAKSPNICTFYNDNIYQKRYPFGFTQTEKNDSAFIGIRIIAEDSASYQIHPNFNSYKEYVQSKLNTPLTGPAVYDVRFHVSKSQLHNYAIKKLSAYFNQLPIVRPNISTGNWNRNLALTDVFPYNYIITPQVSSDFLLNQTADIDGYGGWQEVQGYIYVPENVVYNYITLGNFQNDKELWEDITPKSTYDVHKYELYYFIDNLTINNIDSTFTGDCLCDKNLFKMDIEKKTSMEDSTNCCFEYDIEIPTSVQHVICVVNKIVIRQGETVLVDIEADYPPQNPRFNGMGHITGTFCVDKFDDENNEFTIQLFSKEDESFTLLSHCSKSITLNCRCHCNDLEAFPYSNSSPNFQLVKADEYESGNCCWDIVMTNPSIEDSNSCEYDLSDLYLFLSANQPLASYDIFSDEFDAFDINSANKYFKAPSEFILKPNESISIGRICSKGIPSVYNQVTVDFVFSTSPNNLGACKTVFSQTISCDSIISCCDAFVLKVDTTFHHAADSSYYCTAFLKLDYINSPDFCDYEDELLVVVEDKTNQVGIIAHMFSLSDIHSFPITISPLVSFTDGNEYCVHITNLRTQEQCIKCIVLDCDEISTGQSKSDVFEKSSYKNEHLEKERIIIIPNPTDNWVDVYFNSEVNSDSEISIYSLMGENMLTNYQS